MNFIPVLSTLVTFSFTYAVFRRYQKKGGTHLALWAFGLLLYGLGTLSEVWMSFAFNELVLKLWYLTGAMLTAAWLGQGSIQLLVRKGKLAQILTYALAAFSLLALVMVASAPLTGAQSTYNVAGTISEQYKTILTRGGLTIFLTIILNIYGTLGLVGSALYSAFLFWRKKVLANRMFGNILIAAGALSPALAGTFVKAGIVDALYVSEFIGAVLMFIGFMMATSGKE
ncbi:MAG: hypothetical protein NT121_13710 [Chloroflexi bacterium]|nr:hypothetical protein [Chloroflexota bacterium]